MSLLVLDTNVVSYLMRGGAPEANPLAGKYRARVQGHVLAISFMTVAELFEGAYRAMWGEARISKLEQVLRGYIVLPSSPGICRAWARIRAGRARHPISVDDAWIAATAVAHGAALVTQNPSDFQGIKGLAVETEPI
ncbi:MAG: PIN domain-containing protein [Planctomycetes bacterium]|nr:PIN domain-containing protein [Planctomycetota bacterium]